MKEHPRFAQFVEATGVEDVDVEAGVHDEHTRYQVYLRALENTTPQDDGDLIARVLEDPDRVMAESVVAKHMDRVGASGWDLDAWADVVRPILAGREFLERRLSEWLLYRDLVDAEVASQDQLHDASDWLQRRLVEGSVSRAVLEALAEVGRTKRVRNTAKSKLGMA